jgi:hypothetical protein
MPDQAPKIESFKGSGRLVYDKKRRTIVSEKPVADKNLGKGWFCKCCGWQGEMPNTKIIPDNMGTAQAPCCPDCDQHAALYRRMTPEDMKDPDNFHIYSPEDGDGMSKWQYFLELISRQIKRWRQMSHHS